MRIVCVAVVGKSNNPLYIKSFETQDTMKFHYIVHSSLDVVDERTKKTSQGTAEMYLGLLCPTEDYKVYGYITNTKIKLIVVMLDDMEVKDADVKSVFSDTFLTFFFIIHYDSFKE
eukprot:TRINITY_DN1952_c0_g1_i2.p1 TRINITY_DN1952_c0_g1~~TRINITY_DN1952_c0_g1_i2.p1  ORF type:complete len:116 (-),score=14.69 TRINITY_DN1952_c0_g1_i2:191-538(-)